MSDKFLIDECLSATLVAVAKTRGFQADHATYLGKSGWQDWNLAAFAVANDYIIVTNNRRDFLRIYANLDLHNGLVVIVPDVTRADQQRLFKMVLDFVEVLPDDGLHIRPWSDENHDIGHVFNPDWG